MLVAAIIAATAALAPSATASIYDSETGGLCPNVSLSGNTVSGGCLVDDVDGTWVMMNPHYNPPVVDAGCTLSFDFRVDGVGTTLYAVNQSNSCGTIGRVACTDNTTGQKIPWPGTVGWVGVLVERIDMCFENPNNPSLHNWEEVDLLPDWEWGEFTGFDQYGDSENGYIANANFDYDFLADPGIYQE